MYQFKNNSTHLVNHLLNLFYPRNKIYKEIVHALVSSILICLSISIRYIYFIFSTALYNDGSSLISVV